MYPECIQVENRMGPEWVRMSPQYIQNVSTIDQECIQNVSKMYPGCIKNVSKMYPECTQGSGMNPERNTHVSRV